MPVAITVRKSEPSPEGELLRGVHAHSTPYTQTVTNNTEFETRNAVLVDFLPAQLEFLGCDTADNTPGGAVEYPTALRLDVSIPDVVTDCPTPSSVDTVSNPAGLPAGVYTRVQWDLGVLAPRQVARVVYRAAIPQHANAVSFPGGRPSATSLRQGANLDNNTGPVATGTPTQVGDSDSVTVRAEDLALQKSVSPGQFTQNGIATYIPTLRTG